MSFTADCFCGSIRQHTSAYVSMLQHTTAYVSICPSPPTAFAGVQRQYLYFCTSKARKLSTNTAAAHPMLKKHLVTLDSVSICTFVPVKLEN